MQTLRNVTSGMDLSKSVIRATSPLDRILGWLRVSTLPAQRGLWLRPCSAIHTLGMRTAIDVILLDADCAVVRLCPNVPPNRFWLSHRRARSMIEMGPGFLTAAPIALGDTLALIDTIASGSDSARAC
jgi:uncharacterized membrane protein (UPF0127 family)